MVHFQRTYAFEIRTTFSCFLGPNTASKAPTQGNNTPFVGNSTSIQKLISSKSSLDTMSNRMSQDNRFEFRAETLQDMHARPYDPIKSSINPLTNGMEYNVKLKYVGVNAYGVHVYTDPLCRYLIRTAESLTLVKADPWVKYLGDFYMGEDDACYVVTMDP